MDSRATHSLSTINGFTELKVRSVDTDDDVILILLALPILKIMGKNIFHAGELGCGNGAKICNNLALGISMIGASEALM